MEEEVFCVRDSITGGGGAAAAAAAQQQEEEEQAVSIHDSVTNEDPPNAHPAEEEGHVITALQQDF